MDATALLLSRLQFAFTISFHIIFPSFTIGLAAWLTILEALSLATGRPAYRVVFEFWLKIFGVAFGLGVVSGIVMAFQFGTNWDVLARMSGPIQGVLLSYETFTAFFLEASFFGILLFGRPRVPPWFYLFSTAMVALGTTLSAFWIMANNSWMQAPVGYAIENGEFVPTDWSKIVFSPVLWVRFPHMLLAAYITGAFCVAATGAWYLLRGKFHAEARIMLRMGLGLAAVLVPVQLFFGHLNGEYVVHRQPSKMAAIEARWHDEKPAAEVLLAWPDVRNRRNLFAIALPPPFGSLIRLRQPDRWRGRNGQYPAAGSAPSDHSVLRVSGDGWLRSPHAVARLGRILPEHQRKHRTKPSAAVGDISKLSTAIHRHIDGLVHRRGRPSAMDGLWRPPDRRLGDALPDGASSDDLPYCLLRGLHVHFRLRCFLHSSTIARRT